MQRQAVFVELHTSPFGHAQVVVAVQGVAANKPVVAPAHVYEVSAQSADELQGSLHTPPPPASAPWHVCVNPQSVLD